MLEQCGGTESSARNTKLHVDGTAPVGPVKVKLPDGVVVTLAPLQLTALMEKTIGPKPVTKGAKLPVRAAPWHTLKLGLVISGFGFTVISALPAVIGIKPGGTWPCAAIPYFLKWI